MAVCQFHMPIQITQFVGCRLRWCSCNFLHQSLHKHTTSNQPTTCVFNFRSYCIHDRMLQRTDRMIAHSRSCWCGCCCSGRMLIDYLMTHCKQQQPTNHMCTSQPQVPSNILSDVPRTCYHHPRREAMAIHLDVVSLGNLVNVCALLQ